MSESHSRSWSRIVLEDGEAVPPDSRRQEFRWKTVKKGRLRPSAPQPTDYYCDGEHCWRERNRCTKAVCSGRIDGELSLIRSENDALGAAFATRLYHIDKLNSNIRATCNMDEYYSSEIEESNTALTTAREAKAPAMICSCPSCQTEKQRNVSSVLNAKLSAAQLRLEVLRDYRVAHEKEAIEWTAPHSNQPAKYFTPVGTAKGRGVSALRPTLQMQNSYDVAALTTNSMVSRPLKTPKEDKPKQLPAELSKAD